jgi:DNA polymerase-1
MECIKDYRGLLGWPEEPDTERLLLFDGNSLAYRSFYAISELSTSTGRPVNAIFGFLRIILNVMRSFPSSYTAVAFDAGGKTFRHELYPEYKAERKEMPDALAEQLPLIRSLLKQLGINFVMEEGIEADDILATIAHSAANCGLRTLIASSDKDLAQLVSENVSLLRPSGRRGDKGVELFDAERVYEKYGVYPCQMIDYLSLVGDSSDNIPGIPSVGPKTAAQLLERFQCLEGVLENSDKAGNKRVRENLRAHRAAALLARRLVTLDTNVQMGKVPEDCRLHGIDLEGLTRLLAELEFQSIITELGLGEPPPKTTEHRADYRTIFAREALDRLVERLIGREEISIDLETTSIDPMRAEIVGIALSPCAYEGYYIPVAHNYLGAPSQLPLNVVLATLREVIEGEIPRLIGQNLKYDLVILYRYGLQPRGISFDTMIASRLGHPERRRHNLEGLASQYLNYKMLSYEELAGKDGNIASIPVEKAGFYAAEDAEIVSRLRGPLEEELNRAGATRLFKEVEMPLLPVLARMELNGILVDKQELQTQGEEIRKRLSGIEEDLYEIAGERFNPNSPKQVATILFDHLGLPVTERTKTGPSTSARVLTKLAEQHPLPGKLVEFRELEKLMNTYIRRLPEAINPVTGRIHTSFHQVSTATGRLSSSEPNLQNIPIRTELGERIRRAFVAPEGSLLVGGDYSQIELRLLAHLAADPALIETFVAGADLHRRTASQIFAIPEERVNHRLRNAAKRINFGIIYGISPYGLARELAIPQGEAKDYIDRFLATYPKVKDYRDRMIQSGIERGYAETILGRRRPLPHLRSGNAAKRNFEKRNAVNTPIQGSAADLIKLAMLRIDSRIEGERLPVKPLLQIHDELIFEVPEERHEELATLIKQEMEGVMRLDVPLVVDIGCGKRWSEI